MMTAVPEYLQEIGFSQYEAQAYITLLRQNPLNGYELAKASGIPRPNIYPVLQKLEERGAVLRLDAPDGTRFVPVPPETLLAKMKQRYQASLDAAADGLQKISPAPTQQYILNLRGYPQLLDHAQTLIESSRQHLLFSIWPDEAVALAAPVQRALDRGVQITTLCLRGCPQPCPACRGDVYRYAIAPASSQRWLVVVSDDTELLAGEINALADREQSGAASAQAVRTRQEMLVNLSAGYIQNSIALSTLLRGLGDRLETALDPQASDAIHAQGQWLSAMRCALNLNN